MKSRGKTKPWEQHMETIVQPALMTKNIGNEIYDGL